MDFNQLKQALLAQAKLADVCGAYQDILIANNESEIIVAGLPLLDWAYRTGILTDDLLNEFDESLLNANGVYRTGTHYLEAPTMDLYFLGDSNAQIIMVGSGRCKVFSVTTGTITEILNGQSYVINRVYSGGFNLTQNDDSISCNEFKNINGGVINTKNNSVCHMKCYDGAIMNIETNNDSFLKVQGFFNSITNGTEYSSMPVDTMMSQQAVYNNNNTAL